MYHFRKTLTATGGVSVRRTGHAICRPRDCRPAGRVGQLTVTDELLSGMACERSGLWSEWLGRQQQ
jgi:hypothetical protein